MSRFRLNTPRAAALVAAGLLALTAGGAAFSQALAPEDAQLAAMPGEHGDGNAADRCQRLSDRLSRIDRKLTADQIRDILAGRIAQSGESTLKVGKVRTLDGGVVAVDIVTTSGSLVATRQISSKTGLPADLEKRCQERAARQDSAGEHDRTDAGEHRMHHGWMGGPGHHMGGMMAGGMADRGMAGLALISDGGPGRDLKLNSDQTRKLAEAALVMLGNPHLKVGAVKEKDADTMTVEIVTHDNALVMRRDVDRHTGRMKRSA